VTGLASDIDVLALVLCLHLICMAWLAGFAAGEFDRSRPDVVHRAGPEVAVLAEVARDHGMADEQERNGPQGQQQYYSNQMFRVSQKISHAMAGQQFGIPLASNL
jgi:hypothetical protein